MYMCICVCVAIDPLAVCIFMMYHVLDKIFDNLLMAKLATMEVIAETPFAL